MDDVRRKGTGGFDRSTLTWKLRRKGQPPITASIKKLRELYGEDIPATADGSRKHWRRYLQDQLDQIEAQRKASLAQRKASSPLQERIASIERFIGEFQAQNRPTDELERLLEDAASVGEGDIDHYDTPMLHPDLVDIETVGGVEVDDYLVRRLNSLVPVVSTPKPTPTPVDRLRVEADKYIEQYRRRGHKGWYQVRQSLDMFCKIAGDIRVQDVTVQPYRDYIGAVISEDRWGEQTQYNLYRLLKEFLRGVEADYNLNYGFLRNKKYNLPRPDGQKVQFTLDQVQTALRHATGATRLMLLLGLNCGQITGDMVTNTTDMVKDGRLVRCRAKLRHRKNAVVGSWLLWSETAEFLDRHSLTGWQCFDLWYTFKDQHGLPEHKALRKTTTQVIQDQLKDEYGARLFRGEAVGGTHGKHYVRSFTPEQIAHLDGVLKKVAVIYGLKP